jgi:ubiquinone/menaquinone biosynthesis C-methylase UbiE
MGRLLAAVYNRITRPSEEACLREWRAELLHSLAGAVLEVGAGTGLNLPYYPRTLTRLVLLEPDAFMRRRLLQQARAKGWEQAEILAASLENLPLPTDAFDAVVSTLVLCSVGRLAQALAEIRRVLKPGGRFVFIEHVAAEDRPRRLKWQHRIEPLWRPLAGNCHLTRRTAGAIASSNLVIGELKRESMRKAWPLVRPTIRGIALKPVSPPV